MGYRGENMTRVDASVSAIKKMILDNKYDEAGYLPSEGELSEILEVSRATIREAVRTLEVRGFVKRIHGKGIVVSDNGVKVMTRSMRDMFDRESLSLDEVLEVRYIIETKAVEMAARNITEEEISELLDIVESMERANEIDEVYLQNDHRFHTKLAECSRNKMLGAIVDAYSPLLDALIKQSNKTKSNIEKEYHYHRNIFEAVRDRNVQIAKCNMEAHLEATIKNRAS